MLQEAPAQMLRTPVDRRRAWKGAELAQDQWFVKLSPAALQELEMAAQAVRSRRARGRAPRRTCPKGAAAGLWGQGGVRSVSWGR